MNSRPEPTSVGRLRNFAFAATAILISTIAALAVVEIGLRLAYVRSPFTLRNFSVDPINQQVTNVEFSYDPLLGYTYREGARPRPMTREMYSGFAGTYRVNRRIDYSIGPHGIRANRALGTSEPAPPVPQGGILAVGDSFTFGAEVTDEQTWPARLEAKLGIPVVNGGVSGYGIDQSVLRAEQLLDVTNPKIIIVSFIPNCVGRNEFAVNSGLVKPYFDVVDGKLDLRNVPVPEYHPSVTHIGWTRLVFGHLYLLAWVADRLGKTDQWVMAGKYEVQVATNKGREVTCLLWRRLADKVAGRNIKLIAFAQYAGVQVKGLDNSRESQGVIPVLNCAREAGFEVVDSYDVLRKQYEADETTFWRNWVHEEYDTKYNTGHMSGDGNMLMADLLADYIRKNVPLDKEP